jgi:hypothetical protein
MTVFTWIGVGVAGLLAVSLLVGLAIGRILGMIGDDIAQLLEAEPWTTAPLTREAERMTEGTPISLAAHARDRRSRSSRS